MLMSMTPSHRDELEAYNKIYHFLKEYGIDLNVDLEALQTEYKQMQTEYTERVGGDAEGIEAAERESVR